MTYSSLIHLNHYYNNDLDDVNSNKLKYTVININSLSCSHGFSSQLVISANDMKNILSDANITTIVSMYVTGGYSDVWMLTASLYGNDLYVQCYSNFQAAVSSNIKIFVSGY